MEKLGWLGECPKGSVVHYQPFNASNNLSSLSETHGEKLALIIGTSVLRNTKLAIMVTIVKYIYRARAGYVESYLKIQAKDKH